MRIRRMARMRWDEFEQACPEIAGIARERFERDELVMVGTLRKDGSPRVSPNEIDPRGWTAVRLDDVAVEEGARPAA